MTQQIYCALTGNKVGKLIEVAAFIDTPQGVERIASHLSRDAKWAEHDIGASSFWKHDEYRRLFPQGYEVVWVPLPLKHEVLSRYFKEK